jgi:ketosteroid isomerase-like protein
MDTRQVIETYYKTVNAGDWETWLTLFDDNVVMEEQLAGHLEGIEVLRGAVGGLERGYSRFQMTPQYVVIEDDQACVIWRFEGANAAGVPINARGANYFRIEGGKIVRMENFHDTVPFQPFINQDLS